MKISVDKKDGWLNFKPENPMDIFNLGFIGGINSNVIVVITSNTDNPMPKLQTFKISVESLVQALMKTNKSGK